ncbi:MAG: hypothetical protein MR283_01580 [Erysipelotrichaceae bacterium]|nr:hypothetical protein [Erysipelotrichaceae bacterium]MDY6035295.1 hypothetical protein [Bulleidia sp.]
MQRILLCVVMVMLSLAYAMTSGVAFYQVLYSTRQLVTPLRVYLSIVILCGITLGCLWMLSKVEKIYRKRYLHEQVPLFQLPLFTKYVAFFGLIVSLSVNLMILPQQSNANARNIVGVLLVFATVLFIFNQYREYRHRLRIQKKEKIALLNPSRRYTLLIEEVIDPSTCSGIIHGKICVGDTVNIHISDVGDTLAKVISIQQDDKQVQFASEKKITVKLDFMGKGKLVKFGVISSMVKDQSVLENPGLCGLLQEYRRFVGVREYMGALLYEVCHGKYYMLRYTNTEDDENYVSVHMNIDPSKTLLTTFTDWHAILLNRQVYDESSMSVEEEDIIACFAYIKEKYDAMVINPFGPNLFIIDHTFMNKIMALPGYQEEIMEENE